MSATADPKPGDSSGSPTRVQGPKALGCTRLLSRATGRELEGKWGCRDRTGAYMGSWGCKARTFNHYTIALGPAIQIFLRFILFLFFFIGKADIQRGETERKIFRPMIHSLSKHNGQYLCQSEARSLFWVSHAGAGSQSLGSSSTAFPGHRQGAGREAGLPG